MNVRLDKTGMEIIPAHMRGAMERYLSHGLEPGSFLTAVLCNDLSGAFLAADHINRERIGDFMAYLWWNAPSQAWGSRDKYIQWVNQGGLNGLKRDQEADARPEDEGC